LPAQVVRQASQSILPPRSLGKRRRTKDEYRIYNVRTLMYSRCVHMGGANASDRNENREHAR
jgi:hypothetical protein